MGADLLLAYLPAAEITEDRKRRLHEIVNHLDETHLTGNELQHVADDPESIRDMLHQHIELFANAAKSREVAQLRPPHMPYAMLFTGGLSWGPHDAASTGPEAHNSKWKMRGLYPFWSVYRAKGKETGNSPVWCLRNDRIESRWTQRVPLAWR